MNFISAFFAPIKANINMVIGVLVLSTVLGVGLYVWTLRAEVSKQNEKIATLTSDKKNLNHEINLLREGLGVAESANKASKETIAKMLEERKKADAAVAALAKKDLANTQKINDLNAYIDLLSKDPTNDGALAPVLVETLKAIKQRKEGK